VKVAVVTSFPEDASQPHGGVEAVSVNLCRALSHHEDLEIHVVTLVPGMHGTSVERLGSVQVHRLPDPGGPVLLKSLRRGRQLVCRYVERLAPDVVHAHDTYGLMVTPLRLPRVFTVHGFIFGDTLVSGERFSRVRSLIWKIVETRGWSRQHFIVSISPYVRERLSGHVRGVIRDIENPVAEEFFTIERKERPGVIFSAAVIAPRKNTVQLVEAFARCRDLGHRGELRLAGTVQEPRYGELVRERIRALGLEGSVHLLGGLPVSAIREELAQAALFALVSYEENSPMGIEEAMAAGVPVVTSNRCGMPYMVRHGESGFLVDPNDLDDIAGRLGQVLSDQALRRRLGERSAEIARDRFHPAAVARLTRELYYEAVRSGRRGPARGREGGPRILAGGG
jgi:glycosyltransferase involved in cell wall biosynthesis